MTAQNRNRITAAIAVFAFALIAGLLANMTPQSTYDTFSRRPSTFFTDPSGARALYLVMKRFLPDTEIFRRPLHLLPVADLPELPSTIIAVAPRLTLSTAEASYLDGWLKQGGQLILASPQGWPLRTRQQNSTTANGRNDADISASEDEENTRSAETLLARYAPNLTWLRTNDQPTQRTTHTTALERELKMTWSRSFTGVGALKTIAGAGGRTLAVEIPVERGRIIAIADHRVATNSALGDSDNAVWLVTLAAAWGNGLVLFDEYHHGFGAKRSVTELTRAFLSTPWGWLTLQLIGAGLLLIFAYSRRFGRITEPPPAARASAVELVDARAGIFRAARAQGLAAELIVQNLCYDLGRAQGKTINSHHLDQELEHLAKHQPERSQAIAALRAAIINIEQRRPLSDQEFIAIGRTTAELTRGSRA
jgi:hypothetical protein